MTTSALRDGLMQGKTAFITGGTSGINLAIAERFLRAGAKVTVLGRDPEKAKRAEAELSKHGEAFAVTADVRDYAALEIAIAKGVEKFGSIDTLVSGAAGNFPSPAAALSSNGFKAVVDIDLVGTFNACRAAFAHLRKPGASILNISATQAWVPSQLQVHVCAAKAGVDMMTRVLALEWGPQGVRVNSLAPGPVDETEGMTRLAPTDAARDAVRASVPLKRFASKEEIAEVALFLSSGAASYIHGTVMVCDGGQSLIGFDRMVASLTGGI